MENNNDFLQFLIHEDIYLIDHIMEVEDSVEAPISTVTNTVETFVPPIHKKLQAPSKDIIILFENMLSAQMPEAEKEYLGKILGAVKKSFSDVQLINTASELTFNIQEAKFIISFDAMTILLDRHRVKYQLIKDGSLILKADKLSAISQSPELRKSLWGALQQMFLV